MSGYKEFFRANSDYVVKVESYACEGTFDIEELYQAFKERLIDELKESNIDKPKQHKGE